MSKQSEAKEAQGYVKNPIHHSCRDCRHMAITKGEEYRWSQGHFRPDKLHCTVGDFKVGATAICDCWEE